MSKVVVSQFVSLDGVMEDPAGTEGSGLGRWSFRFDRGPEGHKFKLDEAMASPRFCSGERPTRPSRQLGRRGRASSPTPAPPRLARRAGVEKRVHSHGLRHAHAAELAAEGVPVNVVQQQLGHGSLATTDRYLRHIAPAERIAAMRAREWAV